MTQRKSPALSRLSFTVLSLAALSLGACSTVKEAVQGPQLAPMGYPAAMTPQTQMVVMPPVAQPASSNSLWRNGARAFFNDQRARKVGDILTVQIDIDDRAQTSNTTSRSRTGSTSNSIPSLFGLESSLGKVLPSEFDPSKGISTQNENKFDGNGSVSRSEKVSLTVAAVVAAVMPNGNLVIQGRQEVRTNREVRELTVAGIVRPEDVSSANTIKHTQIAEARISYGGRGDVSRMQAPTVTQSLVEKFSPF
ncbi:MAG: flagellar basal body L-ring protein FlgH [Asticcacaulis sp.]